LRIFQKSGLKLIVGQTLVPKKRGKRKMRKKMEKKKNNSKNRFKVSSCRRELNGNIFGSFWLQFLESQLLFVNEKQFNEIEIICTNKIMPSHL